MNRNQILCRTTFGAFLLMATVVCGQKSKTYKESFTVDKNATVEIKTSYTDIEFETWSKNQIEVTATVELVEATDEEAKRFFEKDAFSIVGNSKSVQIRSKGSDKGLFGDRSFSYEYSYEFPDKTIVEPLFEQLTIPDLPELLVLPELPPMPPIPNMSFDYDAYKKDGDKYMEKWKKQLSKNFDEEYRERFEDWGNLVAERAKARAEQKERREEQREKVIEQRERLREERREIIKERRNGVTILRSDGNFSFHTDSDEPSIFYFSSDGENKKIKVKRSIKIKMPKSVKLKLDVRHGEVKLAENTKNINASLSYSSLHALTIDGGRTDIKASYSPVLVERWKGGALSTKYSDKVDLKEVGELTLSSVSSNVRIDKVVSRAVLSNRFGALAINEVGNDFQDLDIQIENGELEFFIPETAFKLLINERLSDVTVPKGIALDVSTEMGNKLLMGTYKSENPTKVISIDAKFSDIVLKQ
ncbi:MAG: hypothetical protein AAF090_01440 [Bacteroidota bacterium]